MPMTADQYTEQQRRIRGFQAYYDEAMRDLGVRAPPVMVGETGKQYDCRVLSNLQMALPATEPLRKVDVYNLDLDVRNNFRPQIVQAYVAEKKHPTDLEDGELRPFEVKDQFGVLKEVRWHGNDCFVKQMGRPGRRVVSFLTNHGYVDASGRGLR
jgi:hypothetical protein